MDAAYQTTSSQPYTILRIKRKRNEEPIDALAVESRVPRKKSRGGIGLFKFAQTVEPHAWDDEQKNIQEQISRLAREGIRPVEQESLVPAPAIPPPSPNQERNRRYTIINAPEPEVVDTGRRIPTAPPKVLSSKEVEQLKNKPRDFRLYDAILASEKEDPIDSELEKFMPMIRDYLKLHDISTDVEGSPSQVKPSVEETDDYVWDVFYHKPATLSEWNSVAAKMGTLTGLPPSTDSDDSDGDSEVEDEANEDSNDEAYYKNDYPDEESSEDYDSDGSDAFHESSDHDDLYQDDRLRWR